MTIPRFAAVFVVVVIAMTVFGSTAFAQGFGVKGGATFSDFSSDVFDFNNKTGTELGAFFGGNRSGVLGWQGEVNWLRRKTEVSTGENIRIDYIQLAGLLRLNIGTQSPTGFAFYGLVGPGFNFKIGDEIEGVTVTTDAFKSFDIGLIYGGGVEIKRIILEGRFEQGLKNVNELITTTDLKSRSFSVLVGWRFR
jgi:Outer membrane protein beta-barrel domain